MTDTARKSLTVRMGRFRSDRYPAGTWDRTAYEDGQLVVVMLDGTRVVYAAGCWLSTRTAWAAPCS